MEEKNPLDIVTSTTLLKKSIRNNAGGRPSLAKVVKFSPQPKSIISRLLNNVREKNSSNVEEVHNTGVLSTDDSVEHDFNDHKKFGSITGPESLNTYEDANVNFNFSSLEYSRNCFDTHRQNGYQSDATHPQKCKNEELLEIVCYICSHRSSSYKAHRNHLGIHKNQPYKCNFPNCSYTCKLSSNLIKHKRKHTSEKPYLCDQCTFRSNFGNSLKVHKRIHTLERPYVCQYCSYRCNSSSNLKKHCIHRHREQTTSIKMNNEISF